MARVTFKRSVIVTGFMGSGYERVGREVARRLDRSVYNTFDDKVCRQAWRAANDYDADDLASRAEIYNSLVLCRDDIPPRVILLRARPFGRLLMQHMVKAQDVTSIFVDTSPLQCMEHIASPDWKYHSDKAMVDAAFRDLHRDYEEVSDVVGAVATVTFRPDVWPSDFGDQLEELLPLARILPASTPEPLALP